jgi:sec-independent protein translocase protein TatA
MFELSPWHLLIVFGIALLLFGPKKLPELGKGIGEGFRALKDGMKDKQADPPTTPPAASTAPPASSNPDVKS